MTILLTSLLYLKIKLFCNSKSYTYWLCINFSWNRCSHFSDLHLLACAASYGVNTNIGLFHGLQAASHRIYTPCKWPTGLSLSNYTATAATMNQNFEFLSIIVWCFVVHICEEYARFFSKNQVLVSSQKITNSDLKMERNDCAIEKNLKNVHLIESWIS